MKLSRRSFFAGVCATLLSTSALANGFLVNPYVFNTAAAPTVTRLNGTGSTASGTVYTLSSIAFGTTLQAGDMIVVGVSARRNGADASISSMTYNIDGAGAVAATSVVASAAGRSSSALFRFNASSGTNVVFAVTVSASCASCAVDMYLVRGHSSATPNNTNSQSNNSGTTASATLNIPANGVAIAVGLETGNSGANATWTNLTERQDRAMDGGDTARFSSASDAFVSAQTGLSIQVAHSAGTQSSIAMASWG